MMLLYQYQNLSVNTSVRNDWLPDRGDKQQGNICILYSIKNHMPSEIVYIKRITF